MSLAEVRSSNTVISGGLPSSPSSCQRATTLDEDLFSSFVDHHFGDRRVSKHVLNRAQEGEDSIEATHSAPRAA